VIINQPVYRSNSYIWEKKYHFQICLGLNEQNTMIRLSTEVALPESSVKLSYRKKSMMMGSCFAESVGTKLQELCFPIDVNPFGILYNPVSIANSIEILLSGKLFKEKDLFFANGLWNSFYHHSRFSNADKNECLIIINNRISQAAKTLRESNLLFITFGTSWVFEDKGSGQIVSNCHKLPASTFRHYRLNSNQIVDIWIGLIEKILNLNHDLNIVFTVSPIRHLKDGEHENQLSKAVLLVAVDELIKHFMGERILYFPSYEIVLDELRDYRFYASDLVHMNEIAISLIREKVESVFIGQEDKKIAAEIEKLRQALEHKPLNPENDEYQNFIGKQIEKIFQLKDKFYYLDLQLILSEFYLKRAP
jgi:hypothetical protein